MPNFGIESIQELKSSPELVHKIKEYCIVKTLKPGDVLVNEDAYIRSIPIVTRGSIRVIKTEEDGREILLYYLTAGDTCVMSFLGGIHHEPSKLRAEVEEEAEIYFLPIDKVTEFIKEYPQWLEYIFRLYHKRFDELLQMVNSVAFKKVDERLLLLLSKKVELTGNKEITISHEQLANELGTARVVVSRLLKQMEEEHKVELGRNKIKLL